MNELNKMDCEIIHAMFDHNLNVHEAADAVFLHRNSLMYRLKRIQKITGKNPRVIRDLLELLEQIQ